MRKLLLLSVVLLCVVGLWAEKEGGKAFVYSGKIGIFRPSSSDLKDAVGSSWFLFGINAERPINRDTSLVVSLEYTSKSRTSIETEPYTGMPFNVKYTATEMPILFTWRKALISGESSILKEDRPQNYPYFGIGAGLYSLKIEGTASALGISFSTSDDTWKIGFHILVGAQFSSNMFAELRWNTIGKWYDTDFGGYSLLVGIKF